MTPATTADQQMKKLNAASLHRIIDPDSEVLGAITDGQLLPDDLLYAWCGLDPNQVDLSDNDKVQLSRASVGCLYDSGIVLELAILAAFAVETASADNLTAPRYTYILHEIGEETRHSRLFIRLLDQLDMRERTWLERTMSELIAGVAAIPFLRFPAVVYTLLLAGEEIPDLFQRRAAEAPEADQFIRDVSRYHRHEEARHLRFARIRLHEIWPRTSPIDRLLVRYAVPLVIHAMVMMMVRPSVYEAAGLPGLRTWLHTHRAPHRLRLLQQAIRPVIHTLVQADAFPADNVPITWQWLADIHPGPAPASPAARPRDWQAHIEQRSRAQLAQ